MSGIKYPDVTVKLTDQDGNAFAIIGNVAKAIRREVGNPQANDFVNSAMDLESYDALLMYCMQTVNVI